MVMLEPSRKKHEWQQTEKKFGKIEIWEYIPNFSIFPSKNHLKHLDAFSTSGDNGKTFFQENQNFEENLLEVLKIKN
jgi:hypothetical protein